MDGEIIETSVGRLIFNRALPEDFPYQNRIVGKKEIAEIVEQITETYPSDVIAQDTRPDQRDGLPLRDHAPA